MKTTVEGEKKAFKEEGKTFQMPCCHHSSSSNAQKEIIKLSWSMKPNVESQAEWKKWCAKLSETSVSYFSDHS